MAERRSAERLVGDGSVHLMKQHMDLLSHYNALVQSSESEMLQMIDLLDKTRIGWLKTKQENAGLKAVKESIERENKKLQAELETTNTRLKESQAQVTTMQSSMQSLAAEIQEYQRRFQQIKTMLRENCENAGGMTKLKELSFMADAAAERAQQGMSLAAKQNRGSDLSQTNTDDIDYDKTGETLEDDDEVMGVPKQNTRYGRPEFRHNDRRSQSQKPATKRSRGRPLPMHISEEDEEVFEDQEPTCPTPPKRSREAPRGREITTTTTITIDASGRTPTRANVVIKRPPHRRSVSAPGTGRDVQIVERTKEQTPKTPKTTSTFDVRSPATGFGSGWNEGVPISERKHRWKSDSKLLNFSTPCTVCSRGLSMHFYRCIGMGCTFVAHDQCRSRAPVPCVPYKPTPKKSKQGKPRLVELCPDLQPRIPGLLIRCVAAIEKDRLGFEGLYRIPGNKKEVTKLLEDFNSKVAPDLSIRETEVITSCIVQYLKDLREPLVPANSFREFELAAKDGDYGALASAVNDLPIPNRDTLAYMCAHWQRVAENAAVNKMTLESLAKCLAQTVIDGSKRAKNNDEDKYLEAETRILILRQLLQLERQYWMNFVNSAVPGLGQTPRSRINLHGTATPSGTSHPSGQQRTINFSDESMLGPVCDTPPSPKLVRPVPRRVGKHGLGVPY